MARTITFIDRLDVQGRNKVVYCDINITSYTNPNGESVTPGDIGLKSINFADLAGYPGRPAFFNTITNKLTVHQDVTPAASAALPEVPNTTNLGSMRCKFEGIA